MSIARKIIEKYLKVNETSIGKLSDAFSRVMAVRSQYRDSNRAYIHAALSNKGKVPPKTSIKDASVNQGDIDLFKKIISKYNKDKRRVGGEYLKKSMDHYNKEVTPHNKQSVLYDKAKTALQGEKNAIKIYGPEKVLPTKKHRDKYIKYLDSLSKTRGLNDVMPSED